MLENVILHALLSLSLTEKDGLPPVSSPGEVCYDPFGCFSEGYPWSGTPERPVPALPMPLNVTTPIFCFYTPTEPTCHELYLQNIGELYKSSFDHTAPLYVITHGYMESASLEWMVKMRKTLLKVSPNVGVVSVDWSRAAHPPYAQSVANIRLSGTITGYLLHLLVELYDVPLGNIHLIGHSLGSHFMSYAGEFVKSSTGKKVGRITGLDPAGPYFLNAPQLVRLDPFDAEFVDVIHTDIPKEAWEINKLGHPDPIGHVDYYPNGGFEQAGCVTSAHARVEEEDSIADGMLSYIGCNHQRSHSFFTESVSSKCQFLGVMCNSWEEFLRGSCWGCSTGQCLEMGFKAAPLDRYHSDIRLFPTGISVSDETNDSSGDSPFLPVTVFMGTNPNPPYCAEQYRVTVRTSDSPESQQSGGDIARFTITIRGLHGEIVLDPPETSSFIEPGGKQSWVGFSSELGPLTALQVDYEEDQGLLHALIWRFSPPSLFIDSFVVEELSTGLMTTFQFCGSKLEAGESKVLFPDVLCKHNEVDGTK